MSYVDGFIVAVPRENVDAYKEFSAYAGSIWKEYGALEYVECLGNDVPYGELTSFPRAVLAKEDEVVVFAWIRSIIWGNRWKPIFFYCFGWSF